MAAQSAAEVRWAAEWLEEAMTAVVAMGKAAMEAGA